MELIRAGSSIYFSTHEIPNPHLHFILTDPDGNPEEVVAVMVCTAKWHTDKTVVLEPGDHPFIRHRSSVQFGGADFLPVGKVQNLIKNKKCFLKEDMSAGLLQRVRAGLLKSIHTKNWVKEYCRVRFAE